MQLTAKRIMVDVKNTLSSLFTKGMTVWCEYRGDKIYLINMDETTSQEFDVVYSHSIEKLH